MSKKSSNLLKCGYEFVKMCPFVSKKSLLKYFGISERSAYYYQSKLGLKRQKQSSTDKLFVDICYGDGSYNTRTFESFEELNAWIYAQPYYCNVYVNNDEGNLRMHIRVQTNKPKPDVKEVEQLIKEVVEK